MIRQDEGATATATATAFTSVSSSTHVLPIDPNIITMDQYYPALGSRDQSGNVSPSLGPATDPWQYVNWNVPGWFVTDYDEENPLLNFGGDPNVRPEQDMDMGL
jgi:hypothetical protein